MIQLPASGDERRRLAMVRSLGFVGNAPDPALSAIASLAADLADAEVGVVTLLDAETVHIVGAHGFEPGLISRWDAFCPHVLGVSDAVSWIPDARLDARFSANRYVRESPRVRFYAGSPLRVNGCEVGALSVAGGTIKPYDDVVARRLQRAAAACEAELAERHRTFAVRQALSASADALIDCDDEGLILSWSDGAERLFGASAAKAIGSEITRIVPAEYRDRHRDGMRRWRASGAARLGRRLELPAVRDDGSGLDIELWMSVSHDGGRSRVHANIRDISERRAQERELAAAKARAEAANSAKTAFLATVSHELRTPLNGISACAGLLAAAPLSEEHRKLVDIVTGATDQLGRLIGDILDIARGDAGELKLAPAPTDLGRLLADIGALFRLKAEEKGLLMKIDIAEDVRETVSVDHARLKQVLGNLLANAIKFTDAGSVALSAVRRGDMVRVDVSDTGIGFAPEVRDHIFERFQQADSSITRRFGGTGLGLAISRDLVHAMGGDLDCASEPGRGSTFTLALPLPILDRPKHDRSPVAEPVRTEGLRVLLVDDHAINRQVAGMILDSVGIATRFAEDGREALEALQGEPFDLILMDMMMPVMDGLEATRRLRAGEAGARARTTPLIMLTANTLPEHVAAALAAGADDHLAKPISPASLLEAVSLRVSQGPAGRPAASAKAS